MKRALIVDDHPENLYLLEVLLKGHGFETVDRAENGALALALARGSRPDLIISDILMPVMDGYAFCKTLKSDPGLNTIPFIFYTATFTTAKDEELALSLGADRFVIKPQEPDILIQIINQVLRQPRSQAVLQTPESEQQQILREYSEALFHKLEKKMADLELVNRELQHKNKELQHLREEAECASRAKMRFLQIMSHELRTPLNVILGSLQLSEYERAYDPEMVKHAKQAVYSMLDIIDNILEASRLESAEPGFVFTCLNVEALVAMLSKLFGVAVQSKGLQLDFAIAPDLPQDIQTDVVRLKQIMVHLLNNAIKFTEKGTVMLRLSQVPGPSSDRPLLQIEVHDTGVGIATDKQKLVFEYFTQGDDSDTREHGGIGLGLSLTKRLVELMGGTITLQSRPGSGSIFSVLLPFLRCT